MNIILFCMQFIFKFIKYKLCVVASRANITEYERSPSVIKLPAAFIVQLLV